MKSEFLNFCVCDVVFGSVVVVEIFVEILVDVYGVNFLFQCGNLV